MTYEYEGLELTPKIFAEHLILLFDGKEFDRMTAVSTVVQYHRENGGVTNRSEYISTFKKASKSLRDCGLISRGQGIWRLNYKEVCVEIVPSVKNDKIDYSVDKYLGDGNNAVYIYYYDIYKRCAQEHGKDLWECKIGRTDVDPIGRIMTQSGTCYPEPPHIALIIKCEDSALLEKAFHDILKLKGRWLDSSPGKEWFITSPEEIEYLYSQII